MLLNPTDVAFFLRFNVTGDPEPMFSYMGYQTTEDVTEIDAARVNAAQAAFWTVAQAQMTATYTVGPSHCLIGQDGGPPLQVSGTAISAVGSASGDSLPNNTAMLVKKVGVLAGRRNRGRMFIPGVPESISNSVGILTTLGVSDWQANIDEFLQGGSIPDALFGGDTSVSTQPCIFHSTGDPTPAIIGQLVVSNLVATQRRRLRR